jgi:hypothetical protein
MQRTVQGVFLNKGISKNNKSSLDMIKIPKNIFLDIIEGRYTETPILYRDENVLIFDGKFLT